MKCVICGIEVSKRKSVAMEASPVDGSARRVCRHHKGAQAIVNAKRMNALRMAAEARKSK